MTDLSHDAVDDGFHEIHLSGKQLVFLFIAFTCVSVVIFLCGVFVGRGVRAARGEEPPEVAATAPASAPAPAADAGPPATEPPAPPPETPDALSYHKRLQGETPAAESLKKPAAAEPPPPAADPVPVNPPRTAPPPAQKAPAPAPTPATVPTSGRPGKWYVQVLATGNAAVAEKLVARLAGKGYPAYMLAPAAGDVQTVYRVRVGRYDDHNEAEAIRTRIAKEEQFKPYIDSR